MRESEKKQSHRERESMRKETNRKWDRQGRRRRE